MIQPVGFNQVRFSADKTSIDQNTGDYKDPLMQYPLRGAAFSNEVGEALRPVIGNYATVSWAPALLYIGADVYDKYKNNQTEYSPNSKRCLKQAVFQGMASIMLPLVAVKSGQNSFSQFGKLTKDKISINSKEHVSKVAQQFVANGKMHAFSGRDEECIEEFKNITLSSMDYNENKKSIKNFFKIFKKDNKKDVENYAENTIKDLINLRKNLLNPSEEFSQSKLYKSYKADISKGQTPNVAVKTILSNYQAGKMLKGNFTKTLGGFAALALAIKPIDYFVEEILIDKVVGPKIDKLKIEKKA